METITNTPIETFIKAIGNFGFPLVLAVYLLLRFEKKIESLTEAINQLQQVIKKWKICKLPLPTKYII